MVSSLMLKRRADELGARAAGDSWTPNKHLIIVYDVIYFVALVSVSILLLTAWLSPRIRRASTWFTALGTFIIGCSANLMLLGRQNGPPPSPGSRLCLTQAALIHASAILGGLYSASFILQAYMTLRLALNSRSNVPQKYIILLHAVPSASFVIAFVGFLMYGLANPTTPQRTPTGMYCHISSPGPREIAGGIALVSMLLLIIVEVLIIIALRRASGSLASLLQKDDHVSRDSLIRVIIFSIGPILAIVISCFQYLDTSGKETANVSILLATVPCFVVVVFGSQKDILQVWTACWHRVRDSTL
ncbi:hypothetical protein BDZ97DRAFT_451415 [Flammula alnicola]|nr:hypothetical protein BDZ97DRAFT_451415 [Flammula alnicola]